MPQVEFKGRIEVNGQIAYRQVSGWAFVPDRPDVSKQRGCFGIESGEQPQGAAENDSVELVTAKGSVRLKSLSFTVYTDGTLKGIEFEWDGPPQFN